MSEASLPTDLVVDPAVQRAQPSARGAALSFAFVAIVVLLLSGLVAYFTLQSAAGDVYQLKIFDHLFVRYDGPAAIWMAAAFVASAAVLRWTKREWFDGLATWVDRNALLFAALAFALMSSAAVLAYQAYPLSLDEFTHVFQAEIFEAGRIYGQYPNEFGRGLIPLPNFFILYSDVSGRALSSYWPGHALLLTPFVWLGVPWLLNPLAGSIGLLLLRRLMHVLAPESPSAAGWAMLFLAASPAFSVNAASFYTMNLYLVTNLGFAVLIAQPTPRRLFAAGLLGSFAFILHNPVAHGLWAIPWVAWLLVRPNRWRNIAILAVGYAPLSLLLGGGWLYLKTQLWVENANGPLGEGPTTAGQAAAGLATNGIFTWPSFGILYVRFIAALKLFLWAVPGLLLLAAFGVRRYWSSPVTKVLTASMVLTFVFYFFVGVDQGHGWGYRYFHGTFGALPILGALWIAAADIDDRWTRYVGGLVLASLVILTPQRMWQVHEFVAEARSMAPPRDLSRKQIAFVYAESAPGRYYAWDAVRNDPFLRSDSWMLQSRTPELDEQFVKQLFPSARLVHQGLHGTVWDLEEP